MVTTVSTPRKIAATAAASAALVKGRHTPVDAAAATRTMTLPTGSLEGLFLSVEKVDSSTNVVNVTGSIRGVAASTYTLAAQYESVTFSSDATGSWWPIAETGSVRKANAAPLAAAGQTPSQLPVVPGTVAVGSLAQAARADHIHPSAGVFSPYGDGRDGIMDFDGVATFASYVGGGISLSGGVYKIGGPISATKLIVRSGVVLDTGGQILHASDEAQILGTIRSPTHPVGAAAAQTGATNSRFLSCGCPAGVPPAGGTGNGGQPTNTPNCGLGSNGGAGGAASGGTPPSPHAGLNGNTSVRNVYRGGGLMGAFTGKAAMVDNSNRGQNNQISATVIAGGAPGSAGAGDGTNSGGAGGDGGFGLILNAKKLTGSGLITAPGCPGGVPPTGNCGGGGGGGGGYAIVNTTDSSGWTGTLSAPGGAPGAGVGTGLIGNAGVAGFTQLNLWT